jgi:hypothetical protein
VMFLEVTKKVVVSGGQIYVFRNIKVKICQFPIRNGCLVRSGIVFKKRDSFRKLVSTFGDQLLQQFPVSLQAKFHLCPGDKLQHLDDFCVLNFFARWEPLWLHSFDCSFISESYIWIQVSPIVMSQFRNPTRSRRNRSKLVCEASIQSCFWSALRHLGTHLTESFLNLKSRE